MCMHGDDIFVEIWNTCMQYMIGSLQRKCDESSEQTKAAESMVIELKTSKQRSHQC